MQYFPQQRDSEFIEFVPKRKKYVDSRRTFDIITNV